MEWMLAIVLMPLCLVLFGFVAACTVWVIPRYAPAWMHPLAARIKKYPAIWGYILVFGALAIFMTAGAVFKL